MSTTSVTLKWNAPLAEERNGAITGYDIQVSRDNSLLSVVTTTGEQITIESLDPQNTYFFKVAAKTSVGRGPFSTEIPVITIIGGKCMYVIQSDMHDFIILYTVHNLCLNKIQ